MFKYLILWLAVGFPTAVIIGRAIDRGDNE